MATREKLKKTTVILPQQLLDRAMTASGTGITQTIRLGLQLLAARQVYDKMRLAKGSYRSAIDLDELRED